MSMGVHGGESEDANLILKQVDSAGICSGAYYQ